MRPRHEDHGYTDNMQLAVASVDGGGYSGWRRSTRSTFMDPSRCHLPRRTAAGASLGTSASRVRISAAGALLLLVGVCIAAQ